MHPSETQRNSNSHLFWSILPVSPHNVFLVHVYQGGTNFCLSSLRIADLESAKFNHKSSSWFNIPPDRFLQIKESQRERKCEESQKPHIKGRFGLSSDSQPQFSLEGRKPQEDFSLYQLKPCPINQPLLILSSMGFIDGI